MQPITSIRDRAISALVGLAVGDALGTPVELLPRDSFEPVAGYRAGGSLDLQPGEWTDDTSMAVALADALLDDPLLNTGRVMENWVAWMRTGAYSDNGRCFGIGNGRCFGIGDQTSVALRGYADDKSLPEPAIAAGNGAIMRLAPVVIRHWSNPAMAVAVAGTQARLTHNNEDCAAASVAMAAPVCKRFRLKSCHLTISCPQSRNKPPPFPSCPYPAREIRQWTTTMTNPAIRGGGGRWRAWGGSAPACSGPWRRGCRGRSG